MLYNCILLSSCSSRAIFSIEFAYRRPIYTTQWYFIVSCYSWSRNNSFILYSSPPCKAFFIKLTPFKTTTVLLQMNGSSWGEHLIGIKIGHICQTLMHIFIKSMDGGWWSLKKFEKLLVLIQIIFSAMKQWRNCWNMCPNNCKTCEWLSKLDFKFQTVLIILQSNFHYCFFSWSIDRIWLYNYYM